MHEPSNTRAALVTMAGMALFGDEWSAKVAEALNLSESTLRSVQEACLAGNVFAVDASLVAGIVELLRERAKALESTADLLCGHLQH